MSVLTQGDPTAASVTWCTFLSRYPHPQAHLRVPLLAPFPQPQEAGGRPVLLTTSSHDLAADDTTVQTARGERSLRHQGVTSSSGGGS